ncbi:MAG: L-glutamate gamma-semialdehyde dehydrogenase [Bacteroidota bacterium]|nr:L-glutamate gamma-semialdehyde dehydrogenase [Bacteroidota bacterium]
MANAFFNVPIPVNEPVKPYSPDSLEKHQVISAIADLKGQQLDIPAYINGQAVREGKVIDIFAPHNHKHKLGQYHKAEKSQILAAIDAAMSAKTAWENTAWYDRCAIFLKAADLLAGPYRAKMNAATMLAQSKNVFQAEIDAACEFIDFLRFNAFYATEIYKNQPESAPGMWNRLEYRALEGFVFALTPFNFTSIAGNLPASAALMGNTVVWKPSDKQVYSAQVIMEIFQAAGLPAGVINLIYPSGQDCAEVCFNHYDFGGIHFTGSTSVFQSIWQQIGNNIHKYKSYPRIVGETGGKDFILAHESADVQGTAVAIARGAFEYQGQKCSAASRAYIPSNIWPEVRDRAVAMIEDFKMGDVEDFGNFINAVIDEKAFDKITGYIDNAKNDSSVKIVTGGTYDKTIGYFIAPTIIEVSDPNYVTMCDELFGPVLTVYVYEPKDFEKVMTIIDGTSPYALTGSIIATDRYAIVKATEGLKNAAGNFYINDKPTGAVVGQQPFGGARGSGTNDKAGSSINLMRWVSPRTIKETFAMPQDYIYPFLGK